MGVHARFNKGDAEAALRELCGPLDLLEALRCDLLLHRGSAESVLLQVAAEAAGGSFPELPRSLPQQLSSTQSTASLRRTQLDRGPFRAGRLHVLRGFRDPI